jgi:hypothetical protein
VTCEVIRFSEIASGAQLLKGPAFPHQIQCQSSEFWRARGNGANQQAGFQAAPGRTFGISEILAQIDREIAHLQQARALLIGPAESKLKKSSGRPKGLAAKVSTATMADLEILYPESSTLKLARPQEATTLHASEDGYIFS